jgi:peptidoglycan/xylan/chitin deacetylase (PgdA/CDA1 family)
MFKADRQYSVTMRNFYLPIFTLMVAIAACNDRDSNFGKTEITTWADDKKGAISITYDDATINQFRKAIPIMDSLSFKGTFFINTCDIPNSKFAPKFIGRPLSEIIKETDHIPTSEQNLFERASALRFLDIVNAVDRHNQAGSLFENGKIAEAISIIEKAFEEVRKNKSTKEIRPVLLTGEVITWPEIKTFAERGHEFGNHTISHPRLAILDEANLLYELEKCKEEIYYQLGQEHLFSAECPFGTENKRVMAYAYKVHPALRNRMPEEFLEEINRGSKKTPHGSKRPYTQWQRGPLQRHSVEEMKSWVDTLRNYNNVWLVLTFHGIDGIGWEAKPSKDLSEYFKYMKRFEQEVWVETFGNVTKYIRERMHAGLQVKKENDAVSITLTHNLDSGTYEVPLTLKTFVPNDWKNVVVKQDDKEIENKILKTEEGNYVLYEVVPNSGQVTITGGK